MKVLSHAGLVQRRAEVETAAAARPELAPLLRKLLADLELERAARKSAERERDQARKSKWYTSGRDLLRGLWK